MDKYMKTWLTLVVVLLVAGYPAEPSRLQQRALKQESNTTAALPAAAIATDAPAIKPAAATDNVTKEPNSANGTAATAAAAQPKATYDCYHYSDKELEAIAAGQAEESMCTTHGYVFDPTGARASCGGCWCCAPSGTHSSGRQYLGCLQYDRACNPSTTALDALTTDFSMTVEKCARTAALNGYKRSGVQGKSCYGVRESVIFPFFSLTKSWCTANCPGDASIKCGYKRPLLVSCTPKPAPFMPLPVRSMLSLYATRNPDAFTGDPPDMRPLDAPYVGCFREPVEGDVSDRLMKFLGVDDAMTIDKCNSMARDSGFTYAAVQFYTQCFGSNTVQQYIDQAPSLEAPSCDTECAGNRFQTCGGAWSNSIYYVGNDPAGPDPSNKCVGVNCPTPPECQAGGGCNPADGSCYPFTNVMNGQSCSGGGSCHNGRCVRDPCAGVYCPDPPECKTGGRCNPINGQCDLFQNGQNGAACSGGGACIDGECQLTTGIQNITFVTGGSSCPSGYAKLPQDLNEGLIPTYARTSIFACVKRTSDPAKMLHSLRFVDGPGDAGTWCRTLYETRLMQNLNAGSTGYKQLKQIYTCVEYPSDNPQIPWLVLDVMFVTEDVSNCPADFNMNGGVDLNGLAYLSSPLPIYACIKMLM